MEVDSIDLFDTLITRDVYKPTDLFYFVGKKAQRILENLDPYDFQKKRIEAERIARKVGRSVGKEEVGINDIYDVLRSIFNFSEKELDLIKSIEIQLEKEAAVPIAENITKLNTKSIIISDFYLYKDVIEEILKSLYIKNYKELFISSEYNKTKASGNLYKLILERYRIRKHIGDNINSDYIIPRSFGINAELYLSSKPTRYEEKIYKSANLSYEFRSILSGSMKAARLSKFYNDPHLQTIHEVSTNVIGPFLFHYVYWILSIARMEGINKLFFFSRDGQILNKIASLILEKEIFCDFKPTCRYIYVSRKTLYLPSVINEVDLSTLPKILRLDTFEEELRSIPSQDILKTASEKRELLLSYLIQEGFDRESVIGIVDVGWMGRLQYCLSKILDSIGYYNGIRGFYVSLFHYPVYKNDKIFTFLSSKKDWRVLHAPIIETFTSATHGLVVGYQRKEGKIVPILKEKYNREMLKWGLKVQQDSIIIFTKRYLNALSKYEVKPSLVELKESSKILLDLFINKPTKSEAKVYGLVAHYPDPNETKKYQLAKKLNFDEVILSLILKRFLSNRKILWMEGTISLSLPDKISRFFLAISLLRRYLGIILNQV